MKSLKQACCLLSICLLWNILAFELASAQEAPNKPPNFVLMFADDLGYADLNCFGGQKMSTPNLDQMAAQGMRLTSFYASQAVCSASRSSLMTGCYNVRVGIQGALGPGAKVCLNPDEMTIAEVLKTAGYATAIFGKWHLGDHGIGLPLNHGFDHYHGLPYSNDMWPFHPSSSKFPKLPLIKDSAVVDDNVTAEDQTQLTRWATQHAIDFIKNSKQKPFFLYMPYHMPHVPLFVSDGFKDKTGQGLFADVIAEIDWSVGQVLATLAQEGLDENTLVWFTSDNGPWLSYGNHAGSAYPLREGKGTTWEGGVREPTVVRWPGKVPASTVCDEVAATIDVLPTLVQLASAQLPTNKIDGKSIWPLLSGVTGAKSPHEAYYYYWAHELQAVRSGNWKLHFPHSYRTLKGEPGMDDRPGDYTVDRCGLELYDLSNDLGEQLNVASAHPDVVKHLEKLADSMRDQLGDSLTGQPGREIRAAGEIP
jgi:arylsulfatase A